MSLLLVNYLVSQLLFKRLCEGMRARAVVLGDKVEIVVLGGGNSSLNRIQARIADRPRRERGNCVRVIRVLKVLGEDAKLVKVGPPIACFADRILGRGVGVQFHSSVQTIPED